MSAHEAIGKEQRSLKTILVVDDERNIRRLLEAPLRSAGYQVEEAADGAECLEKLQILKPDLIILDWMMPVMDGVEVMKQMQANPRWRNIPVIFLTVRRQEADISEGWQTGVVSYQLKPFKPPELLLVVDRILFTGDEPPAEA